MVKPFDPNSFKKFYARQRILWPHLNIEMDTQLDIPRLTFKVTTIGWHELPRALMDLGENIDILLRDQTADALSDISHRLKDDFRYGSHEVVLQLNLSESDEQALDILRDHKQLWPDYEQDINALLAMKEYGQRFTAFCSEANLGRYGRDHVNVAALPPLDAFAPTQAMKLELDKLLHALIELPGMNFGSDFVKEKYWNESQDNGLIVEGMAMHIGKVQQQLDALVDLQHDYYQRVHSGFGERY